MGLGKSLQSLTIVAIDAKLHRASKILVVCPVTLKGNWADEIEKFTRFKYLIFGEEINSKGKRKALTPQQRTIQLLEFLGHDDTEVKIVIANYEQLTKHVHEFNLHGFDIAIFDEAHYLQNAGAKRTEAAVDLSTKRTFLLSGTPMLNQVDGLWALLYKCDPARTGNNWSFTNRYCVFGGYKNKQIIGVKNEKELRGLLHSYMLRRMKKDVLDLPDVQIIQRRVDLKDEQKELYDEVIEELKLSVFDQDDPQEIENALTKFLRLKQICGTTFPFSGIDNSSKLDLAIEDSVEILKQEPNKLVVFTQFRDVLECYASRLEAANPDINIWELHGDIPKADRMPVVREWSACKEPAVLVCMLQVAGVGLNMTTARHAFFLDKLFTPGMNQQAIDRLHRIGASTTQAVQVFEYICRNTIENRVEQILHQKRKLFGMVVEKSDFKKRLIAALMAEED